MTKKFLITRPNYDLETSYLHDFSKEIVAKAHGDKNIHITDLENNNANRDKLEKSIAKESPGLVFLNGHGDEESVCGHDYEVILDKNNVGLTKDKIVYALACDSLSELGKTAIEKGAKAYIGYRAKFMCARDPSRSSSPSKDKNALPFKKACFVLIDSLIFSGNTVSEAIELTKASYRDSIKSYSNSEDYYGDPPLIGFALTWDLVFLDMEGDLSAVL